MLLVTFLSCTSLDGERQVKEWHYKLIYHLLPESSSGISDLSSFDLFLMNFIDSIKEYFDLFKEKTGITS